MERYNIYSKTALSLFILQSLFYISKGLFAFGKLYGTGWIISLVLVPIILVTSILAWRRLLEKNNAEKTIVSILIIIEGLIVLTASWLIINIYFFYDFAFE
jgi:hypothetical protein